MALNVTKVFQNYITNIFISIIHCDTDWKVYFKNIKNGKLVDKSEKSFEKRSEDELPHEMKKYLIQLQEEYNFVYIALFLQSMGQGAVNGTSNKDFEKNSINIKNIINFKVNKTWSVYSSHIDINWIKTMFEDVGIDFVYSPFVIQHHMLSQSKLKNKPTLFILNNDDSITISVFDTDNLLFGAFFKTTTAENLDSFEEEEDWEEAKEEEGVGDLVQLDTMDNDIDGFGDIEDLSDISTLDDTSNGNEFEDLKEDDQANSSSEGMELDLKLYGRDLIIYKYLLSALKEYYKNPLYNSYFIEKVVLYDAFEMSDDLIKMLEEDLFMDLEINKIDIQESMFELMIKEVF